MVKYESERACDGGGVEVRVVVPWRVRTKVIGNMLGKCWDWDCGITVGVDGLCLFLAFGHDKRGKRQGGRRKGCRQRRNAMMG